MSPSLLYLKPLRNSNTFLHVIYKSKKKTNLLCILNNVFQYNKIRTRKRNAKKSIKTEKIWNPALFGIRNPLSWNPESSTRNPESTGWDPESKTVMDSLTWGDVIVVALSSLLALLRETILDMRQFYLKNRLFLGKLATKSTSASSHTEAQVRNRETIITLLPSNLLS